MRTLREKTSVTEPKALDKDDWLKVITHDRELHQRMASPRGRLNWLFAFGYRRGELPEDRDQHALACEVALFVFMTGSGRLAPVAFHFVEDSHEEVMKPAIRELSIQVGNGIDAFVDGKGAWTIPITCPTTRALSRVINEDRITAVFDRWDANDVRDWTTPFMLAAADAVLAEAPNLRRCAGCARVFAADDRRERFHDKRCATTNRVSAWRMAKELEAEAKRRKARKHSKTR